MGNVPSRVDADSSPRTERSTSLSKLPDSTSAQSKQVGVNAVRELTSSRPTVPHASDSNTWKPAAQALETSRSNQSELAVEAPQAETDPDRLSFIETEKQDVLLDPNITDRSISVLNLPDLAVNQLAWLGVRTIGELAAALPGLPRSFEAQRWRNIQCALQDYLERQHNFTQMAAQAPALCDTIPPVKSKSPANEVIVHPPASEELAGAQQVRRSQAATSHLGPLPEVMEDRSITELSLSTDALECLQRAGFETIGELWAILAQGYSRLAIPDMSWLLWKEIWLVTTRHATSGIVDSTPLDARFAAWFAQLNESQRQVLEWRYGLTEGQDLTLEETGERLNLTRERVRQIERKALELLQHPSGQGPVHALIAELYADVVAGGGVMSETQLGIALAGIADIGDANPQGAVRLLLETSEKLNVKIEGVQAWCLPQLCDLVPLVGLQVIDILRKALAPLSLDELVQRCKQTQGRHDQPNQLYDKFILACVRVNEKLVERHDGSIGLATWERHWQDDIILALRRRGEPAHYTAIADAINASLQNGQHVTARVVHTCLMRYPDIFVCVGVRGTYGLREWNEEQGNSAYMDVLTQVLQEAGHSLEYSRDSARSGRAASPSR